MRIAAALYANDQSIEFFRGGETAPTIEHALHQELGVDQVILDTQVSSADQSEFIEAMHRWAKMTGLRPRPARQ